MTEMREKFESYKAGKITFQELTEFCVKTKCKGVQAKTGRRFEEWEHDVYPEPGSTEEIAYARERRLITSEERLPIYATVCASLGYASGRPRGSG